MEYHPRFLSFSLIFFPSLCSSVPGHYLFICIFRCGPLVMYACVRISSFCLLSLCLDCGGFGKMRLYHVYSQFYSKTTTFLVNI